MSSETHAALLEKLIRQAIDATIEEHGDEMYLGEGYIGDEILCRHLLAALLASWSQEQKAEEKDLSRVGDEVLQPSTGSSAASNEAARYDGSEGTEVL